MKKNTLIGWLKPFWLASLALTTALFTIPTSAKLFDGGVDSENLGKGDYVYVLGYATNRLGGNVPGVTDIPSLMSHMRNQGMNYLIVKSGTGSTNYNGTGSTPQFNSNLVYQAHLVGLKIFAYTRSYGDNIPGEVALATNAFNLGADGFVFDAEAEWESSRQGTNGPSKAWQMLSMVKTNYPTKFLGHAPFMYITSHNSFPYKEFGYWCDAVMPQCYWPSFGITPAQCVVDLDTQWNNWQNGLSGIWTNAIKPLAPTGEADTGTMPAAEVTDFVNALKNTSTPATAGGYKSVNWWRADLHTNGQWGTIAANNIGTPAAVPDVIVDNSAAVVTGTWTVGTSANDKYSTNYVSRGQGTGANYVVFTPNIPTNGNYKTFVWHPAGSNRTTNAPITITHGGGTVTTNVNQTKLGGSWNYLGTYPYNAGTSQNIKISDTIPDAGKLVMVDAVMFQFVQPPPAAPSGLSATAATGPVINLTWTDNSSDEVNFIIARSTTAGGPYTDVGGVASSVTTFSDAAVAASTTYYYVVRAANAGGSSANSSEASATSFNEVADIIIDNPAASPTGSWSAGTSSGDKYGADYRFKSQGTGAASYTYAPTILTPGDYTIYEWHPAGGNRSSGTPHIITHAGGVTTNAVNQKVLGGQWNFLGVFNFAAGSGGSVRITDGFPDAGNLVMADAIKFVYGVVAPPNAPSDLSATAISSSQINLNWTDNSSNEDNFIVGRSTVSGGPYTDIVTTAANVTSYNNTGLSAGTTYYYVVRAVNSTGGASANSAPASATTMPNAPDAPSGLVANVISQTQIDLSWTDNSANEDSFIVARSATSGGSYTDIATLGANVTAHSDTGLTANTAYYYVVRAVNAGGASANTAEAAATTLPNVPAAPSGLAASTVSQTQINLSWADNSDNEDNFIISRSATSGGSYTDIATLGADTTAHSDTGLTANTAYYYVVRAINAGGASANSAEAGATTLPNAPTAPSGLSAGTISQTQINLSWADNSDNEDNFILSRSATSGGPYADIATLGANATAHSDTGLSANTTYYYVVRAVNTGGTSVNSAEADATTLPNPPAAPSGLAASTVSQTQINLSWADNADNEVNFIIARSETVGGPYADIATLGANATAHNDTGLSANTTYYYVVRAVNTGGASANAAEANTTTLPNPPAAPSGLVVSTVSQTQLNLTWTDNANNEDSFIISRSAASGGPYTDIATLGANATAHSDTGLTAETAYYYVVRAVNIGGSSADAPEASGTTLPNAPLAPTGLSALAARATQINLAWTDTSANEANFIIGRSGTSGGPYTDIATVAANATAHSDTGLTASTTYYYVVRAVNAGGVSANAAQASAVTYETDLLIDNKSAAIVGSWSTGTSATDKYSTDYRFKSQGTGLAYLQFTPYVAVAGVYQVYEWHPQGGNRETNAPHIISHSSGVTTNYVNQRVNGGAWNLLGTYTFAAGSAGYVRIADAFVSTNSLMADAVRLVYVAPPAAPSGLSATPANSSQINLSWTDNSTDEVNFTIARSDSAGGPYTDVAAVGANVTAYNDAGLSASTTYYYVVRATGAGGASANTTEASATTLPTPPAAPSSLNATTVSQTQINLAWTDNSGNEANFIIARSTVSGGPYTDIATVAANTVAYNSTGLAANTTYYYVVRAVNAGGASANTVQASATTLPNAPSAPSSLTATAISSSQINLTWTDNSSNEANFIIGRSATSGGPYTDLATVAANTVAYSNTGLASGTTYYYVVRAINAGGASANSAQASATTLSIPAAPSGLSATAISSGQINLAWTDNSANEANFIIARSTTSGGPYSNIATVAANTTAYNNTGLAAATTYYYVVRATNAAGASANSAQASATTFVAPPSPPGGLSATAISSSQINLAWTDNSPNEANFIVARSTVNGGPYTDIATVAANTVAYSNTGLNASTTYYYVVRAVNAGGTSPNSNQASATTQSGIPTAPSGLTATALTSTSIRLNWTDNSANEANFIIARSTVSGGPYTDVATVGANVITYTNTALKGSTTYYFVVKARNASGTSANSNQASATTLPVADILIDNPSATVVGSWSTGTSATDKYLTNYRFKSAGTGAAHLTFRPNILVAGNYQVHEWHPAGSNRTTAAKHIVAYNGGSVTNNVNQQINGGAWRLLGTYNFAVGTNGYVRINDSFTGSGLQVMADGIKFVYVP